MSLFSTICWYFTAVMMTYNVWILWRPIPLGSKVKQKTREAALNKMREANKGFAETMMDEVAINMQKSYENLILYTRFIDKGTAIDLDVLAATTRVQRQWLRTTLSPMKLKEVHVDVFMKFMEFRKEQFWTPDEVKKQRKIMDRTMIYAMSHLDDADRIIEIVGKRGVYKLKQVKSLMGEIDSAPTGPLNDGIL